MPDLFLSERQAKIICKENGCRLPRHGYEQLINIEGQNYWLGRTYSSKGKSWWARRTAWKLGADGKAHLSGVPSEY